MWDHFPNHLRDEEKVVIVYPYGVASFVLADYYVGERLIHGNIVLPALLLPDCILRIIRDLVMKSWPKDLLAISIIMTFVVGIGYEDWY